MIVKRSHAIAGYVALAILTVAGIVYCVARSGDDVLFTEWLATASRSQVWLFVTACVAVGVALGRTWSK